MVMLYLGSASGYTVCVPPITFTVLINNYTAGVPYLSNDEDLRSYEALVFVHISVAHNYMFTCGKTTLVLGIYVQNMCS